MEMDEEDTIKTETITAIRLCFLFRLRVFLHALSIVSAAPSSAQSPRSRDLFSVWSPRGPFKLCGPTSSLLHFHKAGLNLISSSHLRIHNFNNYQLLSTSTNSPTYTYFLTLLQLHIFTIYKRKQN